MKNILLVTAVVLLGAQTFTHAATLVSNAGNPNDDSVLLDSTYAVSFTTGSGPGWNLDSVSLELSREVGASDGQSVNVDILTDDGGSPSVSISAFSSPTIPVGTIVNPYTFTPQSQVLLAPNTTYWISVNAASAPPNDGVLWQGTDDLSETGETGWSIGNSIQQFSGSWSEFSSSQTQQMAINGTAVPEPTGALLAGFGALALLRRRRS